MSIFVRASEGVPPPPVPPPPRAGGLKDAPKPVRPLKTEPADINPFYEELLVKCALKYPPISLKPAFTSRQVDALLSARPARHRKNADRVRELYDRINVLDAAFRNVRAAYKYVVCKMNDMSREEFERQNAFFPPEYAKQLDALVPRAGAPLPLTQIEAVVERGRSEYNALVEELDPLVVASVDDVTAELNKYAERCLKNPGRRSTMHALGFAATTPDEARAVPDMDRAAFDAECPGLYERYKVKSFATLEPGQVRAAHKEGNADALERCLNSSNKPVSLAAGCARDPWRDTSICAKKSPAAKPAEAARAVKGVPKDGKKKWLSDLMEIEDHAKEAQRALAPLLKLGASPKKDTVALAADDIMEASGMASGPITSPEKMSTEELTDMRARAEEVKKKLVTLLEQTYVLETIATVQKQVDMIDAELNARRARFDSMTTDYDYMRGLRSRTRAELHNEIQKAYKHYRNLKKTVLTMQKKQEPVDEEAFRTFQRSFSEYMRSILDVLQERGDTEYERLKTMYFNDRNTNVL